MSKVPSRRHVADDLIIRVGGQEYAPHAGEWVEVRGGPSWSFMRDAATITRMEAKPFNCMSDEESAAMMRALDSVTEFLASRLVAWNWTGLDGKPLPQPSAEVIGRLEQQEVLWLITTLIGGVPPVQAQEAEKNV